MNLVAIFFFLAALLSWSTYVQTDYKIAAVAGVLAVLLGWAWFYLKSEEKKAKNFMGWLAKNKAALLAGQKLMYERALIHRDTPITYFQTCVSFLAATTKIPSRPLITNYDNVGGTKLKYSLIAALLGWWGVPWGFIWTPQVLSRNLKGGETKRLSQLLEAV